MSLSLQVGTITRVLFDESLSEVPWARSALKALEPGDIDVKAEKVPSQPEVRYTWEALSPRGAVFLGELASVGFFGAEAQQLLA